MPEELEEKTQQETQDTAEESSADESQEQEQSDDTDDNEVADGIESDTDDEGELADDEGEQTDDDDGYDSEEEYLNQFDLPGKPKTFDDVIGSYKEAVSKLNRYQRGVADGRRSPELEQRTGETREAPVSTLFSGGHATKHIDELVKQGTIAGDDNVRAAKFWAQVQDRAIDPVLSDVRNVFGSMSNLMNQMIKDARNGSWARFKHKNLITKEQLEDQFGPDNMLDYDGAFQKLMLQNSELFSKFTNQVDKRGEQRGEKKRFKRFSANPRSKPAPRPGPAIYRKYLATGGELDETKLAPLSADVRLKIVEAYLKEFDDKK